MWITNLEHLSGRYFPRAGHQPSMVTGCCSHLSFLCSSPSQQLAFRHVSVINTSTITTTSTSLVVLSALLPFKLEVIMILYIRAQNGCFSNIETWSYYVSHSVSKSRSNDTHHSRHFSGIETLPFPLQDGLAAKSQVVPTERSQQRDTFRS